MIGGVDCLIGSDLLIGCGGRLRVPGGLRIRRREPRQGRIAFGGIVRDGAEGGLGLGILIRLREIERGLIACASGFRGGGLEMVVDPPASRPGNDQHGSSDDPILILFPVLDE